MKKIKIRILLTTLILVLILSTIVIADDSKILNKDETVYVMLNNYGEVLNIDVVNHFYNLDGNEIYDYGNYLALESLSNNCTPVINNNEITWQLDIDYDGDFYSKGTIEKELPINLQIDYYFNDEKIKVEDLAGKTGELAINLKVIQNERCDEKQKEKYMTQIQIPLDLAKAKIIESEKASTVIAGKKATISYSVTPGDNTEYSLILDVKDFELDSIQVTLMKYKLDMISSLNKIETSLNDLESGVEEISTGLTDVEDGTVEVVNGVSEISGSLTALNKGANDLERPMKDYQDGLAEFSIGLNTSVVGLDEAIKGVEQVNDSSEQIVEGYSQLLTSLNQIQQGHEQLVSIAETLRYSNDPSMRALGEAIINENESLESLLLGFGEANTGLEDYTENIYKVSDGLSTINTEIVQLEQGAVNLSQSYDQIFVNNSSLLNGINSSQLGAEHLYNEIRGLPENISDIVDGQNEIGEGITEMKNEFNTNYGTDNNDTKIYSFVDRNVEINSVQFIYKTPEIKVVDNKEEIEVSIPKDKTWYEDVWDKIINLFK